MSRSGNEDIYTNLHALVRLRYRLEGLQLPAAAASAFHVERPQALPAARSRPGF